MMLLAGKSGQGILFSAQREVHPPNFTIPSSQQTRDKDPFNPDPTLQQKKEFPHTYNSLTYTEH